MSSLDGLRHFEVIWSRKSKAEILSARPRPGPYWAVGIRASLLSCQYQGQVFSRLELSVRLQALEETAALASYTSIPVLVPDPEDFVAVQRNLRSRRPPVSDKHLLFAETSPAGA